MRLWEKILRPRIQSSRIQSLLDEVGLGSRGDSVVGTFSAGMRKRLALARSRLEEPELLLLDEPFAALAIHSRAKGGVAGLKRKSAVFRFTKPLTM